jgi:transcriptional regulator with XRE-family HTH domain
VAARRPSPIHEYCEDHVAGRLRFYRERAALTQQELAQKAGITQAQLSRIERLQVQPLPSTIRRLAEVLGVAPSELMGPPDQP